MDENIIDLVSQLNELNSSLSAINDTIGKIDLKLGSNEITYGCRVQIYWEDGRVTEGRVIVDHGDGTYGINRDAYKSTMNFGLNRPQHKLQNLSVGTYGMLEREQWILQRKIKYVTYLIEKCKEPNFKKLIDSFKKNASNETYAKLISESSKFKNWFNKNTNNKLPEFHVLPITFQIATIKEFIYQNKL